MSELLDDIGRSLMLSAMMGIPYQEAQEWKPGDMPSWVEKRWLERKPTTAIEVKQAIQWRDETLLWIETKLEELKTRVYELERIERIVEVDELVDMVFALESFKGRLEKTYHRVWPTKKVKKDGKEVTEMIGMRIINNEKLLIEEYRAR